MAGPNSAKDGAATSSSVFNPDAPEFNPSPIRSSGKLNADAPEFVPGQIPTSYDANLSMLRVPEMVNAGSYKNGHIPNYGRNISQRHQEYVHPQMWMPMYSQDRQMGVPYQQHVYPGNASYGYMSYNYSRPQGYHVQRNIYNKPHAEYTLNNPPPVQVPYNAVVTGNVVKNKRGKAEVPPDPAAQAPQQVKQGLPQNAQTREVTQTPVRDGPTTQAASPSGGNPHVPQNAQAPMRETGAPPKPLTWAERTKLSTTRQQAQKVAAESAAKNEPTEGAKSEQRRPEPASTPAERVVPTGKAHGGSRHDARQNVQGQVPQAVHVDSSMEPTQETHGAPPAHHTAPVETISERLENLQLGAGSEDGVYTITTMLSIYSYFSSGGLEKLRESKEYPVLIFSHSSIRDSSLKPMGRNFGEYSNNTKKGDNWRHSKPFDQGKGFGNNFRFSHKEFSREHNDQPQLPAASESSWVIKQAKQKLDKECQLKRKIMGLLNRLTFEKFDIIYDQIIACGIDTPEHALMLVKFVFGKAVTQHHFIPMYVELCTKLAVDLYDIDDEPDGKVEGKDGRTADAATSSSRDAKTSRNSDFMRILLNCSQESFENNLKPLTIPEDLEGDDVFEFEQKYKHKMRGNMIFVGELFKQKLLAAKLLITCLDQVFSKREECIALYNDINMGNNHLEAMCTLLQTVGRSFDTTRWKHLPEFEKRIQLLAELGKNEDICFRIRCLIKNVLDCRQERWDKQPIHKLEGPCKLQELRSKVLETGKPQDDLWRRHRKKNFDKGSLASADARNDDEYRMGHNDDSGGMDAHNDHHNGDSGDHHPFHSGHDGESTGDAALPFDALKKQVKSILTELTLSHDTSESFLRVTELNLPNSRDEELFNLILMDTIELCAKVTATRERTLLTKWLYSLAETRSSQLRLISCLKDFVLNEEAENSYAMLTEDYPVLPQLVAELLTHMEQGCSGNSDFQAIQRHVKA